MDVELTGGSEAATGDGGLALLFVEDNPDDAYFVLRRLQASGVVAARTRTVDNEADLREALREQWDAVLADFHLPAYDAWGVLAALADLEDSPPCLVVSGAVGEETAAALMKAGAVDFVMKDHLDRLPSALVRSVDDARTRRRRAEVERQLDHEQRERERLNQALEEQEKRRAGVIRLNDSVYQKLVVARAGLASGDLGMNETALSEAMQGVRDVMEQMLPGPVEAGMLRFERSTESTTRSPAEPAAPGEDDDE